MESLSLLHLFYSSLPWLSLKAPSPTPRSQTQFQKTIHTHRGFTSSGRWHRVAGLMVSDVSNIPLKTINTSVETSQISRERKPCKQHSQGPFITGMWTENHRTSTTEGHALAVLVKGPIRRKGLREWEKRVPLTHMLYCEWRLIWKYTGHKSCMGGGSISYFCFQLRHPRCVQ